MYLLFNEVDDPPSGAFDPALGRPEAQSAFWHIGAFANTTNMDADLAAIGVEHLPLYTGLDDPESVWRSGLTPYSGTLTTDQLREAEYSDPRPGGFSYVLGPDGALFELTGGANTTPSMSHVHFFNEHPQCAANWYVEHLGMSLPPIRNEDGTRSERPPYEPCEAEHGAAGYPSLERAGTIRQPRGTAVHGNGSLSGYTRQCVSGRCGDDQPLVPSRGQVLDHIAFTVADLDGWRAWLGASGVTIVEDVHDFGDSRAFMIEGPDRLAIELVEASGVAPVLALGPDGSGAPRRDRLNPMIASHERGQPLFGLYAPANRGGRGGAPPPEAKTPAQLAEETLAFDRSDYVFNGSMEGSVDRGLPAWTAYVQALIAAGASVQSHPLVVKTPRIADDPALAIENIGRQLDSGASGVMFVEVETAEEVRQGLAAMRFRSQGGTRAESVGSAPSYWGLTEAEYRVKADLWPLNPEGELINWTIVESLEGLDNVREIAAVEGIGVLWPGAGTLRGIFSTRDAEGNRVLDEEAWEAAIQKVLSACKEFDVPCGFPANENDIQMRMEQGFSVFVMAWGDGGFRTIDVGRAASGR
jgi:2-keto-3-deoxy-L-rhamnonate aldolase RhmA